MEATDNGATPDVAAVEQAAAVETPVSIEDTIRNTLQEINTRTETPEADKPSVERDPQGKFAKKTDTDPNAPPAETTPQTPETAAVKAAPNTWRKEVAEKWATLPPEVQAEVERREADFHKGIEGYKQKAQFAESMERAIAPHMQTLQQLGVSPDVAVGELMAADNLLRNGTPQQKTEYFAQLAQNYGVDLGQVQQLPQIDPNVAALHNQVRQLQGSLQQRQQLEQQQAQQALNSELAAFVADPAHKHFESVKGHMAALLQANQVQSIKEAYEQAVYANPATRAAVLAEQQAAEKAEATRKAQSARQASSVNVRSRPSVPSSPPVGTMEDTIRNTYRELTSS